VSPTRFDHVAIAVSGMAAAPAFLAGVPGGVPEHGQPAGVFAWDAGQFDGGGRIEILEPRGPDGFATARSLVLPARRHPVLGAVFVVSPDAVATETRA
jgi:hypothetical protein